jgi:hypothetical protein
MPLNQLVDMYAFGSPNVFGINETINSTSQGSEMGTHSEVNHVARNAFISSQYKQLSGIRTQLNQDIFYTRLFNSLQRANIKEDERRLKSMKWLSKWDEFRKIKMQYVDKIVKLLKDKRRIINLITLIKLVEQLRGIQDNYKKLKKYNMDNMTRYIMCMKMYFNYRNVYLKRYGDRKDKRNRNLLRRCITMQVGVITHFFEE